MPTYNPEDLNDLERTLLGVLSVGLPPSRTAGSDEFRVDHVTAVAAGLYLHDDRSVNLRDDGIRVTPEFRTDLQATIAALTDKGLVTEQAAGMPAAPGGFEGLEIDLVDPDAHPIVQDRYLSQQCMEVLLNNRAVYPYLMDRYAKSGEVWRRLRDEEDYGA